MTYTLIVKFPNINDDNALVVKKNNNNNDNKNDDGFLKVVLPCVQCNSNPDTQVLLSIPACNV